MENSDARTEITFVGESEEMVNAMRSLGVGRPGGLGSSCPFQVGDFISYPAMPSLAFRVTYRLFSHGDGARPPRWILGVEKTPHPLAP